VQVLTVSFHRDFARALPQSHLFYGEGARLPGNFFVAEGLPVSRCRIHNRVLHWTGPQDTWKQRVSCGSGQGPDEVPARKVPRMRHGNRSLENGGCARSNPDIVYTLEGGRGLSLAKSQVRVPTPSI